MEKTYSNSSNARRAAKAAGIDTARVQKVSDGCYKIRPAGDSITANAMKALTGVDETKPTKADKRSKAIAAVEAAKPPKAPKAKTAIKAKRVAKAPARKANPAVGANATIIALITKGATISELMDALGWQAHSVRGSLSRLGTAGYTVERTKTSGGESHYKIAS